MAIVRTTETLLNQVLANADKLFALRLETASKFDAPHSPLELYDMVFGEWKEHMLMLPKEIVPRKDEFRINKVDDVLLNWKVVLPTDMPIPERTPKTDYLEAPGYFGGVYNVTGPKWTALREAALARELRIVALTDEIKQFKIGVRAIFKQFSTLAPALKAWPALWDLLPEETKTKHKQVVDRKKPETAVPEVDLDRLTTAVVIAKLTQ